MLMKDSDDSFGRITSVGDEKWVVGFPHKAWYDMSGYYITAFKTGSYPAITVRIVLLYSNVIKWPAKSFLFG